MEVAVDAAGVASEAFCYGGVSRRSRGMFRARTITGRADEIGPGDCYTDPAAIAEAKA
jgi:hypothetical protein